MNDETGKLRYEDILRARDTLDKSYLKNQIMSAEIARGMRKVDIYGKKHDDMRDTLAAAAGRTLDEITLKSIDEWSINLSVPKTAYEEEENKTITYTIKRKLK